MVFITSTMVSFVLVIIFNIMEFIIINVLHINILMVNIAMSSLLADIEVAELHFKPKIILKGDGWQLNSEHYLREHIQCLKRIQVGYLHLHRGGFNEYHFISC